MARHWFGKMLTDWSMTLGDVTEVDTGSGIVKTAPALVTGPVAVTFWNAETGGTQYTDLLDASGTPVAQVMTADGTSGLPIGTIPLFQGPDATPEVTEMWADAGGGTRYKMTANDLGGDVAELKSTVADLIGTVTTLNAMVQNTKGTVVYNAVTSSWPERPAGDPRLFEWVGPSVPTAGAPYMKEGDLWVDTSAA